MPTALQKYTAKFRAIRSDPDYEFGLAQNFVATLLALPPKDRFSIGELLLDIQDDAFERGFEIRNLDTVAFSREKAEWEAKPVKFEPSTPVPKDDFNEVLFDMSSRYEDIFQRVKGSFIFKFGSPDGGATRVEILCDDGCLNHPNVCPFDSEHPTCTIELRPIRDFIRTAGTHTEIQKQNYLAIFLITPSLHGSEGTIGEIEKIRGLFETANFISPSACPITSAEQYRIEAFEDGVELVKGYTSKIFNNRELSFDDEIIIKKLFEGNEMILDYRFLKRGNTGAKVIEIQPFRGNAGKMARFVVKFDRKDENRKIKDEYRRFQEFVESYVISAYSAGYDQTPTREGIRYRYASSDSRAESFSFADLVDGAICGTYVHEFSIEQVIEQLWNCDVFKKWEPSKTIVEKTIGEFYADYLKSEGNVFREIGLIRGLQPDDVQNLDVTRAFMMIKGQKLKTYEKICHGDLHSENFFKDDKDVYLIDFGWTDHRHALIDYVTLECSLKFKHLPFYIPKDEFLNAEKYFQGPESFREGFDLNVIERPVLRKLYGLLHAIRKRSLVDTFDGSAATEYLAALFIIGFRQIQYRDLNQRFALASTEQLAGRIKDLA